MDSPLIVGHTLSIYGGEFDGIVFTHVFNEKENTCYFLSNVHGDKRFKQVFVPIEVESSDFIPR